MNNEISEGTVKLITDAEKDLIEPRIREFNNWIDQLIKLKKAGIDPTSIGNPTMQTRGIFKAETAIAKKTSVGVGGGATIEFVEIQASYGTTKEQLARLAVEVEYVSPGMPNFDVIKQMTVEEIETLLTITKTPTNELVTV